MPETPASEPGTPDAARLPDDAIQWSPKPPKWLRTLLDAAADKATRYWRAKLAEAEAKVVAWEDIATERLKMMKELHDLNQGNMTALADERAATDDLVAAAKVVADGLADMHDEHCKFPVHDPDTECFACILFEQSDIVAALRRREKQHANE